MLLDPNANTPAYDRALCAALARQGCDIELVTAPFVYDDLPPVRGYRIHHGFFRLATGAFGGRAGLADRPALRRLVKSVEYGLDWAALLARLERRPPDLLHVQWSLAPALDRRCWAWLRARGVPIVYTAHNLLPHAARSGDATRYRDLYRAADALVVHTRASASALAELFGVAGAQITVAPHGPLLEEEPRLTREEARGRLGLPPEAPLVLFAGLIEPYKGLGDLIKGFAQVVIAKPDARLVVAGRPNESFATFHRLLAQCGLVGRTHLDLRYLRQAELAAYLCAADVVALPYRETTTSGILMAARRFARPVVATRAGDLAEIVEDGVTGLLVPPSDPRALAGALTRLLADPMLANRLGEAGRRSTLTDQSWGEAARRTLTVYRSLARAARSR